MSQHLTPEDVARLVDSAPGAHEAAHLGTCAACRDELDAMRADIQALSLLPDMAPAPDAWDALERRLQDEGLIRQRRRTALLAWPAGSRVLQIAAALVLFVAGSVAGRLTTERGEPIATAVQPAPAPRIDEPAAPPAPTARYAAAEPDGSDAAEYEPATVPPVRGPATTNPNVTLASTGGGFALAGTARTMDEAIDQLRQAEELYLTALTRYAELATQSETGDPVARLAALQSIVMTTQAALNQTPADPVINGYHLTALAQRDATLRQVVAATDRWY